MKRAFIIHGWQGSPDGGWRTWLRNELESNGFKVRAPQMPKEKETFLKDWLSNLANTVGKPDKDCYFIGHSLGCISILKYIQGLKGDEQVGGCVLIAGFSTPTANEQLRNFVQEPLDFEKVMNHTKKFVVIHSDNDDRVPIEKAHELVKNLKAKFILEKGLSHIRASQIEQLPSALNAVMEMSR